MHSHNYTLRQYDTRHYGEGKAEAMIFDWSAWQRSLLRYSMLPYARQVLSDSTYFLRRADLWTVLHSPLICLTQLLGRRAGFQAGLKEKAKRS